MESGLVCVCCCEKHYDQEHTGNKGFCFPCRLEFIIGPSSGRNSREELDVEAMKEQGSLAWSLVLPHHGQSNFGRKWFVWTVLSDHNSLLREVRAAVLN